MSLPWTIAKQIGIAPVNLRARPACLEQVSAAAATAQTFTIAIPCDHPIHQIVISVAEGTASPGTLVDGDLVSAELIVNGNKYIKVLTGEMIKNLCIMNKNKQATGAYTLYFTDPKIPEAKPLPGHLCTTITLKLVDNAPAASNFHYINVTLLESLREAGGDFSGILVEKYLSYVSYGTNTLWQDYNHERAYRIYSYLYMMDDNGTLSDTKFNKVRVIGMWSGGEDRLSDELLVLHVKALNQAEYMNALDTGFMAIEFPNGFDSSKYTSLKSQLNIPTAGTKIQLRVVERYVLSA